MRQIDVLCIVLADQLKRILQHGHHAQPQQIHFDDPHVRAIFFIPLHDDAPRHGGGLQRHNGIELALADHHAAGVLSQMARQILNLAGEQFEELAQCGVLESETRLR